MTDFSQISPKNSNFFCKKEGLNRYVTADSEFGTIFDKKQTQERERERERELLNYELGIMNYEFPFVGGICRFFYSRRQQRPDKRPDSVEDLSVSIIILFLFSYSPLRPCQLLRSLTGHLNHNVTNSLNHNHLMYYFYFNHLNFLSYESAKKSKMVFA